MNNYLKKTLLVLTGLSFVIPFASAANTVLFGSIENILNDMCRFLVSSQALQGIDTQQIWQPVIGSFVLVFAIVFAATGFVPVLKEHRGSRSAVAIVLAFAAINYGAVSIIFQIGGIGALIAAIVAVVLLLLTLTRSFKTGHTVAGAKLTEAKADASRAEKDYAEENKDKERAERDLNLQRGMFNKESADLAETRNLIGSEVISGTNEIKDLMAIRNILKSLEGVRNEGEAVKLKESYQRQIATAGSIIRPKKVRFLKLNQDVDEIEKIEAGEHSLENDEAKMDAAIRNAIKKEKGGVALDVKQEAGVKSLIQEAMKVASDRKNTVDKIRTEITTAETRENESIRLINEMVAFVHQGNFPAAINSISAAINTLEQNQKFFGDMKNGITKAMDDVNRERNSYDTKLRTFISRI
jgi:hypothetical protein